MKPRTGRVIATADRKRGIACDMPKRGTDALEWCPEPALMCETVPHAGGVSFYHYCAECWHAPAANGGPSAAQRTGVPAPWRDSTDRAYQNRDADNELHGRTR